MNGQGMNFLLVSQHLAGAGTQSARVYRNASRGARYGVAICLDGIHGDPEFNGWELENLLSVYDSVVCVRDGASHLYRDTDECQSSVSWSVFIERELPDFLESVGIADPIIAIYGVSGGADSSLALARAIPTITDLYCVSGYYWWHMPFVSKHLRGARRQTAPMAGTKNAEPLSPAKLVGDLKGVTIHFVVGAGLPRSRCAHSGARARLTCRLWELLSLILTVLTVVRCWWVGQPCSLLIVLAQRHCWESWRGVADRLHTQNPYRRVRVELGKFAS